MRHRHHTPSTTRSNGDDAAWAAFESEPADVRDLRTRVEALEQQTLALFTVTAAHASIAGRDDTAIRTEARADLDRVRTDLIVLIDRLRADVLDRLDTIEQRLDFADYTTH